MSKKNKNYIYTDGKKKFKKIRTYYYIENTTLYLKRLYEIGEVLYGEEVGNYLTLDIRAIVSMPAQHAGKKPLPVLYSRPGYYIYCHKNGTVVVAPDINAINEWLGKFSYDEVSVVSIHG